MQRKFLEDLGLDKEVIDKIMNENGSDLEKQKEKLTLDADSIKSQLETAQTALKEFEGVDVKDLQGKITLLNGELDRAKNEHLAKIADMEFDNCLNTAISSTGARNAKAVMALLDMDSLKASKNQSEDIKKALETVKADNDYLFESAEPIKNPVRDTGNPNTGIDPLSSMRAAMGLSPITNKE